MVKYKIINKTIIAYKIIEVDKNKKGFKIKSTFSSVYAVIELNKIEIQNKSNMVTKMSRAVKAQKRNAQAQQSKAKATVNNFSNPKTKKMKQTET